MARGVNKVILIGNLGAAPQLRYTANQNPVCNLNIATDESYKDRNTGQTIPRVEWHRVAIFGKRAEVAAQYMQKGSKIYIEGKIQNKKWQDSNGNDQYTTQIVVDMNGEMQMLGNPSNAGNERSATDKAHDYSAQQESTTETGAATEGATGENDDFDDDIPF